jgi:hypothetical protein
MVERIFCFEVRRPDANPGVKTKRGDVSKGTNNLNFLINLLDKDFFACYKLKSFNTKEVGDLRYYALFNE